MKTQRRLIWAFWLLCALAWVVPAHAAAPSCNSGGPRPTTSLRINTVTTGGTAVLALNAGDATCGGFLITGNAAGICVNQQSSQNTAIPSAGTSTTGDTTCVGQNVPYYIIPTPGPVSVNSTGSSVPIAGYGLN